MNFVPHFVSSPLDSYIQSVFHFSGLKPDHSIERVVPTGHIFLIFELDGFPRNTFDNETLKSNRTFSKVWVSGMHRNYLSISAHQDSEMFVVQFKPQGSYPFFHFPIHELDEKVVAAEEVFGEEVLALREAIFQGKNSAEKFELAEQWLNDRFDATKTPPKDLEAFLSRLQTEPAGKFTEIVTDYSKTQKHLIDQFKKYIGLTPKYLHRIFRFSEILQMIQKKETIAWTQVAYQCGFSDQSHFIKEFKRFSGFNPQAFIEQEFHKDQPNFFPLDREG